MKISRYMILAVIFIAASSGILFADNDPGTVKQEIASDKAAIKDSHDQIKANAQSAKDEESALKSQIKDARQSGDKEKAKSLRSDLNQMHQENVTQRREDMKSLHEARKEMKEDRRAARNARRSGK